MVTLRLKKDAVSKTQLELKLKVLFMNLIAERGETDPNYAYTHFSVKRIGNYMLGTGYYHETDEYYSLAGFEIEYKYQYDCMDKPKTTCRFCSIWSNKKHHECAPLDFSEAYRPFGDNHFFENGCGDRVDIEKVIIPAEVVQKYISDASKSVGGTVDALLDTLEKSWKEQQSAK